MLTEVKENLLMDGNRKTLRRKIKDFKEHIQEKICLVGCWSFVFSLPDIVKANFVL